MKTRIQRPKLISFFLAFLLIISLSSFAQESKNVKKQFCYSDQLFSSSIEKDPRLIEKLNEQDRAINSFRENILSNPAYQGPLSAANSGSGGTNFIVPVVVYIVHENGVENITDLQVTSQIDKLNDEFTGHGVQFCLATSEGGITLPGAATSGIIHIQSGLANHLTSNDAALKALSPLPSDKYLRIWVVKDINAGSGILGYATFPGIIGSALDGIVMRYDAFGDVASCGCTNLLPSNNQGKVLAHEVGHYFNLYHTFHNGCSGMNVSTCDLQGDRVCDTPPVATNNIGCPALGSINSCTESPDLPDLLDNHMDYTNDNCRTSFTNGQETRMICAINLYRSALVSSPNLVYTGVQCNGGLLAAFSADNYNPCDNDLISFTAVTIPGSITYTWDFGDGTPSVTGNPVTHSYATGGMGYAATLTVSDGANSVSESQQIYVTDCAPISSSQGNWYFYDRAGLDFSSGIPVADDAAWINNTITDVGAGSSGEACADQSDASGNLLFYTDAIHVWDENHTLINSGNDLFGSVSAAAGTIIVPDPGNSSQYCIFTTSTIGGGNPNGNKGLRYSKVQVTGTAAAMTATINSPVPAPFGYTAGDDGAILAGEGITAVASCNGYWIICNGEKAGSRYLVIYELTASGITYHSQYNSSVAGKWALLEASPNGNMLALTQLAGAAGSYKYNFDKLAGIVTSEASLNSFYAYGVSFSPNSELLYISKIGGGLYQYNMALAFPASSQILVSSDNMRALQVGPDEKIYGVVSSSTKLTVINQPNTLCTIGTPNACAYDINGPNLNTVPSGVAIKGKWGLPNMLDANSASVFPAIIACTQMNCFTYQLITEFCAATYNWDFGDPASGMNTSTSQYVTHVFSGPGTYTVTLNAGGTIFTKTIVIGFNAIVSGPIAVCLQDSTFNNYSVSGAPLGATYNWSVTGGTIPGLNGLDNVDINWISLPGTLTVVVTDPIYGCADTVTVFVDEYCDSTTNCSGPAFIKTITCDAIVGGNQTYLLDIGITNPFVTNSTFTMTTVPGGTVTGMPALLTPGYNSFTAIFTELVSGSPTLCIEVVMTSIIGEQCTVQICDTLPNCGPLCGDCEITDQVINGDFQSGNTGFFSTLTSSNTCGVSEYWVGSEPRDKCTNSLWIDDLWDHTIGTSAGSYMLIDGPNGGFPVTIWGNNNLSVLSGETYFFSFWTLREISDNNFGNNSTQTFDIVVNGTVVTAVNTAPDSSSLWTEHCVKWIADVTGLITIQIDQTGSSGYNDYGIDDISFGSCDSSISCDVTPNYYIAIDANDNCKHYFTDNTIVGVGCNVVVWSWNFGDPASGIVNNSSNLQNPNHIFSGNGTYNVCLTVTVDCGGQICTETICYTTQVTKCGKDCKDCDISPSIKIKTKDHCTFDLEGVNNGTPCPSQIYSWEIYSNSGILIATLLGQNVTYTFPVSGNYKICLTIYVLDKNGKIKCEKEVCDELNVECKSCDDDCDIKPDIKIKSDDNCTFDLEGINNGTICSSQLYSWEIYNNSGALVTTLLGQNVTYTFPVSGSYKICLTIYVLDNNGNIKCKKTICKKISADCLSVDKKAANQTLKAWPNPSNGWYYLNVELVDFKSEYINVYNTMGVKVPFSIGVQNDLPFVELETNEKGIYFLTVQKGAQLMKTTLVKD